MSMDECRRVVVYLPGSEYEHLRRISEAQARSMSSQVRALIRAVPDPGGEWSPMPAE